MVFSDSSIKHMNKTTIFIVALIVATSSAFYGGMTFAKKRSAGNRATNNFQNLRNLSPEERQKRLSEMGVAGGRGFRGGSNSGNAGSRPVSGEILSQNKDGFTIKLRNGSTKIIFTSASTTITKSTAGNTNDITKNATVIITGNQNPDGSYGAKTIQLLPKIK